MRVPTVLERWVQFSPQRGAGGRLPQNARALSAATVPGAVGAVRRARSALDGLVTVRAASGALDALKAREGRRLRRPALVAALDAKARQPRGAVWFGVSWFRHGSSVSRPAAGVSTLLGRHASSRAQCTFSQRFRAQVLEKSAESGAEW